MARGGGETGGGGADGDLCEYEKHSITHQHLLLIFLLCPNSRFARSASLMRTVGSVLLGPHPASSAPLKRWLLATDAFALAEGPTAAALQAALQKAAPAVSARFPAGACEEVGIAGGSGGSTSGPARQQLQQQGLGELTSWLDVFRVCQVGVSCMACLGLGFARVRHSWVRSPKFAEDA